MMDLIQHAVNFQNMYGPYVKAILMKKLQYLKKYYIQMHICCTNMLRMEVFRLPKLFTVSG